MLAQLARRLADHRAFRRIRDGHAIDRTDFRTCDNPVEARMADVLLDIPDLELAFLSMRYGLTGETPMEAPAIAAALRRPFFEVLDIGTGAGLRLRNGASSRMALEDLAALEVPGLMAQAARSLALPGGLRGRANTAWFLGRRPIRRLALDLVHEGGVRFLMRRAMAASASTVSVGMPHSASMAVDQAGAG